MVVALAQVAAITREEWASVVFSVQAGFNIKLYLQFLCIKINYFDVVIRNVIIKTSLYVSVIDTKFYAILNYFIIIYFHLSQDFNKFKQLLKIPLKNL